MTRTTCATSHTYFDIYLVHDTPCNMSGICVLYVWNMFSESFGHTVICLITESWAGCSGLGTRIMIVIWNPDIYLILVYLELYSVER